MSAFLLLVGETFHSYLFSAKLYVFSSVDRFVSHTEHTKWRPILQPSLTVDHQFTLLLILTYHLFVDLVISFEISNGTVWCVICKIPELKIIQPCEICFFNRQDFF